MNYEGKKPLTDQSNSQPPERRSLEADRRLRERRRTDSDLQVFDRFAGIAFGELLSAEYKKNGCLEGVNSGNRIDFEAISRMSLISAKVMVRQRRDFAKEYENRRQ